MKTPRTTHTAKLQSAASRLLPLGALAIALTFAAPTSTALPLNCDLYCDNGGFEIPGPDGCHPMGWHEYVFNGGWAVNGGTACQVVGAFHTGISAVQVDDPGEGFYTGLISSPLPVLPNQLVTVSGWLIGGGALYIEFYTLNGEYLTGFAAEPVLTTIDGWTLYVGGATNPSADAAYANALVYSCAVCGGSFFVDDVDLA